MILNKIKKGKIVPSEMTIKLIQREIESSEGNKFLIDGFPRSEENRITYERIVSFYFFSSLDRDLWKKPMFPHYFNL